MKVAETFVLQYTNSNRVEFQYYAEFLRLAGIYVWEYLKDIYSKKAGAAMDFGDAVVLDVDEILCQMDEKDQVHSWANLYACLPDAVKEEQKQKDLNVETNELLTALLLLNPVYEKNNLLASVTALQYFRIESDEIREAANHFAKAANGLENLIAADEVLFNNRYLRYAVLYCKQRANLGRWICRQPLLEFADLLADECLVLAKKYPDFSNAWVLRGLAFETSERHSKDAVEAFRQGAMSVGKVPYASSIYYWIGKRCEGYKEVDKMLMTDWAYEHGYKLEPKYRLCYKMAFVNERWYRWEEVDDYYKKCMAYIAVKGNFLDPLEQEYCYKSAIRAAYNCLAHLRNAGKAIELLQIAERLRENIKDGMSAVSEYTKYYFDLYGDRAQKFIELQLGRMGTLQMYQYFAKAYQIVENREKAIYYSDLFVKERQKLDSRH